MVVHGLLRSRIDNPNDQQPDENFGHSVSLSSDGTILAVGAYRIHSTNDDAGVVYVYQYNGSSWIF